MPTDQHLIDRVKARDESAFDALFRRYASTVRPRVSGIVRDAAAAEDVVQEVFLRLWTRADGFAGGSVKSWLLTTATNLSLNAIRSRTRRERVVDRRSDPERTPAPPPGGDHDLEGAERRRAIRRAVEDLSPAKREVVRLVHLERMELRRVAEELGIPLGTVKSRLHHARRDLARMLDEMEWEDW
jgi:RNA polymerase sigma-70 factor (ECF subfamily)